MVQVTNYIEVDEISRLSEGNVVHHNSNISDPNWESQKIRIQLPVLAQDANCFLCPAIQNIAFFSLFWFFVQDTAVTLRPPMVQDTTCVELYEIPCHYAGNVVRQTSIKSKQYY